MTDQDRPGWVQELQDSAKSTRWQSGATPWQVARETAAISYLSESLGPGRFLPPIGGWSVDYSVVAAVHDFVARSENPVNIMELGSGAGTPWFATIAKQCGGHMITVEHDPQHVARTTALVDYYGLGDICTVVNAPLTDTQHSTPWYDLRPIRTALGDLQVLVLVIDGPPSDIGTGARQPALFALEKYLTEDALVVLDDIVRKDEQATLAAWREAFGDRVADVPVLERAAMFLLRSKDPTSGSPFATENGRLAAPTRNDDQEVPGGSSGTL